jgi:hypothetical protein
MNQNFVTISGLAVNLLGAIILAFSFSTSEKVGTHTDNNGKTTDFILPNFHKWRFRIGIGVMVLGFLIQIMAILFKK